ncbi:MAG TPA: DUF6786 family protein [Bacteroidales bacterium]|nr:DUF6786 family protein [Bacteroidales bacterium]
MKKGIFLIIVICISLQSCTNQGRVNSKNAKEMKTDTSALYGYNRDFLKTHTRIIELRLKNARLVIAPDWQGRVMTSSQDGDMGFSFGWINRDLILKGTLLKHINAFGGEERLWLGPEGGQFSIFFPAGREFVYDNWQTPEFIDSKPWEVVSQDTSSASFRTAVSIINYSATRFDIEIDRTVKLLDDKALAALTGISPGGLNLVAYQSENTLTNKGNSDWKKESGQLSVWMLGMFTPSPAVVIVIPVREGEEKALGVKVNDNYFGKIPADRLRLKDNHIFFRADGKSRGKIGIPPLRTAGVMGSFDSEKNILTLLFCRLPEGITDYVNSAWQIQEHPYSGDAFNSYNDGPLADGSQMGPFYELETSSPAAALKPGESITHSQVTVHITGERKQLDAISSLVLGVSLKEIETAFE